MADPAKRLTERQRALHRLPGVVAVWHGFKKTGGVRTMEKAVVVAVVKKRPLAELAAHEIVPEVVDDLRTDVVETGTIKAYDAYTTRQRPCPGGYSVGQYQITAGTLGVVVMKQGDGALYILSNNHVLANENLAQIGDAILQPGAFDGGAVGPDTIAALTEFVPIAFDHKGQPGSNLIDAALAKVDPSLVKMEIVALGSPVGIRDVVLGESVQKAGRTSGVTRGPVSGVDGVVTVDYGGQTATFQDQLIIDDGALPFSAPGDSGSAILTMDLHLGGLLFAGGGGVTIANRIAHVVDLFHILLPQGGTPMSTLHVVATLTQADGQIATFTGDLQQEVPAAPPVIDGIDFTDPSTGQPIASIPAAGGVARAAVVADLHSRTPNS